MNLIELGVELINDVQKLRADYRAGKVSLETYSTQLDGVGMVEKLANVIIKTRITEERFKKPIIDNQKLISLVNPEKEKVACPGNSRKINRSSCLDWSGEDPPKFEDCVDCDQYGTTRRLLLGEKE